MKKLLILFLTILFVPVAVAQDYEQLTKADKAFAEGDYKSALKIYSLMSRHKDSITHYLYYNQANCYYRLLEYKKALHYIKKAQKIKEKETSFIQYNWVMGSSYWLQARVFSKQYETEKALQSMQTSTLYTQTSLQYSTVAYYQTKLNDYNGALTNLNTAIEMDSLNAYAFSNRSLVYAKLNQLEEARKDATAAIRLYPSNPYAYKHSAMIYIALSDFEKACAELQKAEDAGYESFGNEADRREVAELMQTYCKK